MIILCPSYKRAGDVPTRALFPKAVLCVHEFEEEAYRELSDGEIAVIPDALRGNMARVRNWMLDYGFSRDDELVMVDDDVSAFTMVEMGERYLLDKEHFATVLTDGFRMAREIGARLWGINVAEDPMFYHAWKPIGLHVPVLGTFCCHLRNPLRYDERLFLNEDYDFFLQSLHRYRVVLRFDKYSYLADHLTKPGGCGAYRTMDEERAQAKIMTGKWGNHIVRFDKNGRDTNPTLRSPI